jgi:hypothetical protein
VTGDAVGLVFSCSVFMLTLRGFVYFHSYDLAIINLLSAFVATQVLQCLHRSDVVVLSRLHELEQKFDDTVPYRNKLRIHIYIHTCSSTEYKLKGHFKEILTNILEVII